MKKNHINKINRPFVNCPFIHMCEIEQEIYLEMYEVRYMCRKTAGTDTYRGDGSFQEMFKSQ